MTASRTSGDEAADQRQGAEDADVDQHRDDPGRGLELERRACACLRRRVGRRRGGGFGLGRRRRSPSSAAGAGTAVRPSQSRASRPRPRRPSAAGSGGRGRDRVHRRGAGRRRGRRRRRPRLHVRVRVRRGVRRRVEVEVHHVVSRVRRRGARGPCAAMIDQPRRSMRAVRDQSFGDFRRRGPSAFGVMAFFLAAATSASSPRRRGRHVGLDPLEAERVLQLALGEQGPGGAGVVLHDAPEQGLGLLGGGLGLVAGAGPRRRAPAARRWTWGW